MNQLEEQMRPTDGNAASLVIAWLWVGIPLAWGIAVTIQNALKLFR